MSSAQLDTRSQLFEDLAPEADSSALRQQVAERLAAHRARRPRPAAATPLPASIASPARARAARIAATVAERYARSESYRSFLAAEAEMAIRQAEAAAEVATVTARAVTAAQLDLLESLDQAALEHTQAEIHTLELAEADHSTRAHSRNHAAPRHAPEPSLSFAFQAETAESAVAVPAAGITIRLYEDVAAPFYEPGVTSRVPNADPFDAERLALDDEIAFRQSPTFEEAMPPAEIPANLIEFPRQLIAARRARPRRAEGPLLDEAASIAAESPQLRIFEVEPAQLSASPAVDSAAPDWCSIMLDAQPAIEPRFESTLVQAEEPGSLLNWVPNAAPVLLTASLELRIMAAAVDSCIVLAAMIVFAAAAVSTVGRVPVLQLNSMAPVAIAEQIAPLVLAGGLGYLVLFALYQVLFFTFSDATPGMRYARIGLCTFADENPTRSQMRRRALTFMVSAMPLGLGLIWSWIDTDRLTWHDRLSRIYQRSY